MTFVLGVWDHRPGSIHVRVHQWRRRDSQSIITMRLFQKMTEFSPTMLIVCINSPTPTAIAIREGPLECLHHCSRQIAQQSKKEPSRRGITHRPHSRYHPREVQEEISISRMQACTPLCMGRPLRYHLTCRTQKCAGVVWQSGGGRARACLRGWPRAAKFNSTRLISFHQCAVLPRVVLLVRVWCVVLQ